MTYPNFGDAACAVLLEKEKSEKERGVLSSSYATNLGCNDNCRFPAIGNSAQLMGKAHKYYRRLEWVPFDSDFLIDDIQKVTENILSLENLTDEDISVYAYSQFFPKYSDEVFRRLNLSSNKYHYVGNKYGYTGATSPFLSLESVWNDIKGESGKYIIFLSYGAGSITGGVAYKI